MELIATKFPYAADRCRHIMLVATPITDPSVIVGFVDLDVRPATRRIDPPRPYLSDLAVHPKYRRCGIASQLIHVCEMTVRYQRNGFGTPTDKSSPRLELYICVQQDNQIAMQMYQKLQYEAQSHPIFGVEDATVSLRKNLSHQVDP
jgi:ribosomal protein S18 acetylase RimI-like enzyme